MKTGRPEWDRFLGVRDSAVTTDASEPVFILRASDICAPLAVDIYSGLATMVGASKSLVRSARQQVKEILAWQRGHGFGVPTLAGETAPRSGPLPARAQPAAPAADQTAQEAAQSTIPDRDAPDGPGDVLREIQEMARRIADLAPVAGHYPTLALAAEWMHQLTEQAQDLLDLPEVAPAACVDITCTQRAA